MASDAAPWVSEMECFEWEGDLDVLDSCSLVGVDVRAVEVDWTRCKVGVDWDGVTVVIIGRIYMGQKRKHSVAFVCMQGTRGANFTGRSLNLSLRDQPARSTLKKKSFPVLGKAQILLNPQDGFFQV